MTPFYRAPGGEVHGIFSDVETAVLSSLANQLSAMLREAAENGASPEDSALRRLLPDAYANDARASAEFRRLVGADLSTRKALNAELLLASLGAGGEIALNDAETLAWLRALTDLRLALAARLGIVQDGDEGEINDESDRFSRDAYDWLGYLQESLLRAMDDSAMGG